MQFPLFIELQRSRRLDFLLAVFHFAAALCSFAALWPRDDLSYRYPLLVLLLTVIGWSAWRTLRRDPIGRIRIDAEGVLSIDDAEGNAQRAVILPDSTVFPHVVVLRLRVGDEAQVRYMTLLSDQMGVEQFRQLGLCLRWLVKPGGKTGT